MGLREEMTEFIRGPVFPAVTLPRSIPQRSIRTEIVTTLPVTPMDGDEVHYLADATNGVIWHLRYRWDSTSTYKWEFVGGRPLYAEVTTSESTTSTSYTNLATTGPEIALPLAGDYDVAFGAAFSTNAEIGLMSYAIGGTAAVDADSVRIGPADADQGSHSRMRRKAGLTAVTLTAKYRSFGGASVTCLDRWMAVTPVRVG